LQVLTDPGSWFLDAGFWMLDSRGMFFDLSSIKYQASSIGPIPAQEFEIRTLAQTEMMCQSFLDFVSDKRQYPCK
jgi:hypothetical protein